MSHFDIKIARGLYSIEPREGSNCASPLGTVLMEGVTGETEDYNTFIGALEYIIGCHSPAAMESGQLEEVMNKFRRPEEEHLENVVKQKSTGMVLLNEKD